MEYLSYKGVCIEALKEELVPYNANSYITIRDTNIPYNWPADSLVE